MSSDGHEPVGINHESLSGLDRNKSRIGLGLEVGNRLG